MSFLQIFLFLLYVKGDNAFPPEQMPNMTKTNFLESMSVNQDREVAMTSSSPLVAHANHTIEFGRQSKDVGDAVAVGLWKMLLRKGCHTVLLTENIQPSIFDSFIRYSKQYFQPLLLVDLSNLKVRDKTSERILLKSFWGSPITTCRAVVVDALHESRNVSLRFLETSQLWVWPEVQVILVGMKSRVSSVLQHPALRNSIHVLYVHLREPETMETNSPQLMPFSRHFVDVYSRCLYCEEGNPQIRLLFKWHFDRLMPTFSNLVSELPSNFRGKVIGVGAYPYFPYSYYNRPPDSSQPQVVELLDCMDKRLYDTLSLHLNITFMFKSPPAYEYEPGYLTPSGQWTGRMRLLKENEADVTTSIIVNPDRLSLIDFKTTCETDRIAIVSLKPQALPRYLVITRPFTVDVWTYILLGIMIWGVSFWALQTIRSKYGGKSSLSLNEAIFYGWAVILEDPPSKPLTNSTAQMMLAWWLIVCFLLSTGFRSALVAHLTVESKSKPIDSYEDLVKQPNWGWGFEKFLLSGGPGFYFKYNPEPVIQHIYKYLEGIDNMEGLEKVKSGRFSLLGSLNNVNALVDKYHTDRYGRNPFHFSKTTYRIATDMGMGFRRGAPFRRRFIQVINRLIDGGIINLWVQDVIEKTVRASRRVTNIGKDEINFNELQDADRTVVLRMTHLVGVFFIYLIGNVIAFASFIIEKFDAR